MAQDVVPELNLQRYGDLVHDWAYQALARIAGKDSFDYDVSMVCVPTAVPGASAATAYALVLYLPSALIGHPAIGTARIVGDHPTEKDVKDQMLAMALELRTKRRAQLQAPPMNGLRRPR